MKYDFLAPNKSEFFCNSISRDDPDNGTFITEKREGLG